MQLSLYVFTIHFHTVQPSTSRSPILSCPFMFPVKICFILFLLNLKILPRFRFNVYAIIPAFLSSLLRSRQIRSLFVSLRNTLVILQWRIVISLPSHQALAGRNCLFSISTTTLISVGISSIRKPRTCHALMKRGAHVTFSITMFPKLKLRQNRNHWCKLTLWLKC
jgi:aryl carrier-like protein